MLSAAEHGILGTMTALAWGQRETQEHCLGAGIARNGVNMLQTCALETMQKVKVEPVWSCPLAVKGAALKRGRNASLCAVPGRNQCISKKTALC